ncbi:MAG: UvrD-helicase domain-containing protein [Candidatus Poribacteria bacterium]|nr:UvrD-helicase domain-containing protein [Candidatus Poribacteria bacterium]
MNDLLESLNPVQRQAVQHTEGPLLILSGAGSGKTRVITHRIAHLIRHCGVSPFNILAMTFTNKAAGEMKTRLESLLNREVKSLWVSTFHSTCARILRRDIEHLGYSRSFTIYDTADQLTLIREILKTLRLRENQNNPRAILSRISKAKNDFISPQAYADTVEDFFEERVAQIYELYQVHLRENNALDFDDLIKLTVELFDACPHVLEFYQEKFRYILVDEYQDTNRAQYLLVHALAQKHQNICVVGDDDQCLPAGTSIRTPNGTVPIENLRWEDTVISAAGRGKTLAATVIGLHRKWYEGKLVKITTQSGAVLRATPNHILFSRLSNVPDLHHVYLMYRREHGYRIGISKGTRSDGFKEHPLQTGIRQRCVQEKADKVWILKTCDTRSEAQMWEQYYAFKYGVPTTVFDAAGRTSMIRQEQIDFIYANIDTAQNAKRLMRDLYLFHDYPSYRPKGISGNKSPNRQIVNFTMFSDQRISERSPWHAHRVSLNTTDRRLEKQLQARGHRTRPGRRNTWRIEKVRLQYDEAIKLAHQIAQAAGGLEIQSGAFLVDNQKYDFQPASQIQPKMYLAVERDGELVEELVESVEWEDYQGYVYDLDVDCLHNYIANSICVHNSIYSWRGADINNILDFEQDYPDTTVLRLEQNYRSTQNILEAAYEVVRNNRMRKEKRLWTENQKGSPITCYEAMDDIDEAGYVLRQIEGWHARGVKYGDCVIFYRINAQSRTFEDALRGANIPYQIVGNVRFYERMEVKDMMAYLRVIVNPDDAIGLKRIINVPRRGIGAATIARLEDFAREEGIALFEAVKRVNEISTLRAAAREKVRAFAELIASFNASDPPAQTADALLERSGYLESLKHEGTIEAQSRMENLRELITAAAEYEDSEGESTLSGFLEMITLVSDIDSMDDKSDVVTMMTLHSAKGLEFPIVFMVGIEEGLLPHQRSFMSKAELEEERRLCYVGLTRAKEQVYLTHARARRLYRDMDYRMPSRFIEEIPPELLTQGEVYQTPRRPVVSSYDPDVPDIDAGLSFDYEVGEIVYHPKFGRGKIAAVGGYGRDMRITIRFERGIEKTLVAEYARLQRME